jgi:hypothetical protein
MLLAILVIGCFANASAIETDDDQPATFSMPGSLLLGTPIQVSSSQLNESSYHLNLEPEWKLTSRFSIYGVFLTRQGTNLEDGLYFNQSDLGVRYTGSELFAGVYPTYSVSAMLPWNSQDITQDLYHGGIAPSLKLTRPGNKEGLSELSLALTYAFLKHNAAHNVDDWTNVQSYLQLTVAGEYQISKTWTTGGSLSLSRRSFYDGQVFPATGFDLYNLIHIFEDEDAAILFGVGNTPILQLPADLTESVPNFNQNLNFVYLGTTFAL